MEYVLKTNSLCKNYGHFKALNGLSMNVPKGSIYGLIGKNGAGKTRPRYIISERTWEKDEKEEQKKCSK